MAPLHALIRRRHELASACALVAALVLAAFAAAAPRTEAADAHAAHAAPAAHAHEAHAARAAAKGAASAPKPWSRASTWGAAGVPADGAAVTIPAGTTVLLDRSVSLANLTIEGRLVFARRSLVLATDWILLDGGTLEVGTERAPFRQRAVIQLRDRTPGEEHGHLGDTFIGLVHGRLELHGAPRRSWTRLARTAFAGQSSLVLASTAGWHAGDRIAVASTDFDSGHAEERTIRAVRGRTVILDRPLEHGHHGQRQKVAGRWLDERAEVALLTRNVRVEGAPDAERTHHGGQVMAMDGSKLHIENAEFTRMGQEGVLLRYPIHFHMLGDAGAGSYVRQTSIHRTWNRCLTIHGTNAVRAVGNACFDHVGHGYFLEDGAERRNVLVGNLGFGTHRPREGKAILDSDRSPGTFWITNPDNTVRGNVAAGSEGHGFWIALPEHPTGLFAQLEPGQARAMWPRRTKLRQFASNTAHSNDRDGLHFDNGPRPDTSTEATWHEAHANPADEDSTSLVTTMSGLVAWKNRDHGAWLRGRNHRLVRSVLADNAIGATFASDESVLQDSLVVGESANAGAAERWERDRGQVGRAGRSLPKPWEPDFPIRGFEFYDGRVGVERTLFANFRPYRSRSGALRQQSAIGYHLDDDFSIHARNFTRALRFANAKRAYFEPPEVGHDGDVSAVFLDEDGSLTGRAGRSLMTRNPFLYGSGCRARDDFNAMECTGDYASLIVGAPGQPKAVHPVTIARADGSSAVQTLTASGGGRDGDSATTTILADAGYRVAFAGGTPAKARFVLYNGRDRWVKVAVPHAPGFRVTRYGCNVGDARSWCAGARSSMAALDASGRASYFYDSAAGVLWLKLVSTGTDWDELVVE
jgi:cell migration-inducing and hyaluronan-binding protein